MYLQCHSLYSKGSEASRPPQSNFGQEIWKSPSGVKKTPTLYHPSFVFLFNEQGMWACQHCFCACSKFSSPLKKKMQPSGGKTRPVFGNLCLQRETVPSTWITRLGMSLLKKYKTILLFFCPLFSRRMGAFVAMCHHIHADLTSFFSFPFVSWIHAVISLIKWL